MVGLLRDGIGAYTVPIALTAVVLVIAAALTAAAKPNARLDHNAERP
jgi:cyanate permease